jgi:UDP-N-acetylenolpyruvoylglucosamine reductase
LKNIEVKKIVNLVHEVGWCKKRSEKKEQMKMEIDAGAGWCRLVQAVAHKVLSKLLATNLNVGAIGGAVSAAA